MEFKIHKTVKPKQSEKIHKTVKPKQFKKNDIENNNVKPYRHTMLTEYPQKVHITS